MKRQIKTFALLLALALPATGNTANQCLCEPTTWKDYLGEPRVERWFGFEINWLCDYRCEVKSPQGKTYQTVIRAEHHDWWAGSMKQENGLEGICEGMEYVPFYNFNLNRWVYIWNHHTTRFTPHASKSKTLQAWAVENDCEITK